MLWMTILQRRMLRHQKKMYDIWSKTLVVAPANMLIKDRRQDTKQTLANVKAKGLVYVMADRPRRSGGRDTKRETSGIEGSSTSRWPGWLANRGKALHTKRAMADVKAAGLVLALGCRTSREAGRDTNRKTLQRKGQGTSGCYRWHGRRLGAQHTKLELELYFYLNTVNLSDKIIIKKITIYFNLYKHDLKI